MVSTKQLSSPIKILFITQWHYLLISVMDIYWGNRNFIHQIRNRERLSN